MRTLISEVLLPASAAVGLLTMLTIGSKKAGNPVLTASMSGISSPLLTSSRHSPDNRICAMQGG